MHSIYVLKDERGYYCPPLVNNGCRTLFLGLATQFTDKTAAETVASFRGMQVYDLTPVVLLN